MCNFLGWTVPWELKGQFLSVPWDDERVTARLLSTYGDRIIFVISIKDNFKLFLPVYVIVGDPDAWKQ